MPLELSPIQKEIFEGLKAIGNEISNFYLDGLKLIQSEDYESKSYLIGHVAREIDGGLREILASEITKDQEEKSCINERKNGHVNSILSALGLSEKSEFADHWLKTSQKFHSFAHRRGAFRESRDSKGVINLWSDYEAILQKLVGSYFALVNRLDRFLEMETPTDKVLHTLSNMLRNKALESYFYRNLNKTAWFFPLLKNNHFAINQIPSPIETEEGVKLYFWNQLFYFEKIVENKDADVFDGNVYIGLIDILLKVAQEHNETKRLDNPYIWHRVIKILSRIPLIHHNPQIYNFIPNWFSKRYDNILPSADLIRELLPHVLRDEGPIDYKDHFLKVVFKLNQSSEYSYRNRYEFYFQHSWIAKSDTISEISQSIVKETDFASFIEYISMSLREIFWFEIRTSRFPIEKAGITFEFSKEEESISIVVLDPNGDTVDGLKIITVNNGITGIEASVLIEQINVLLKTNSIEIDKESIENLYGHIGFLCENDYLGIRLESTLGAIPSHQREDTNVILVSILQSIIVSAAKQKPEEAIRILEEYLSTQYYPIFHRIYVNTIAQSYQSLKEWFWSIFSNNIKAGMFLENSVSSEMYFLLKRNSNQFTAENKQLLMKHLQYHSSLVEEGDREKWLFRYFCALREEDEFKTEYETLSEKLGITAEEIENPEQRRLRLRSAETRFPLSFADKSIDEIVEILNSFESTGDWDDPDETSLGYVLERDCTELPAKYSSKLDRFLSVQHVYIAYLFRAFNYAWKNDRDIEWGSVLGFALEYINQANFGTAPMQRKTFSYTEDKMQVLESVSLLITSGSENDIRTYPDELFPIISEILVFALGKIVPKSEKEVMESNMPFPDYLLNSTNGKVINACILFSLLKARTSGYELESDEVKWDEPIKQGIENALRNKVIDAYTVLGFYFTRLNYLDHHWLIQQLQKYQSEKENWLWKAIVESYTSFNSIIPSMEVYSAFFPYFSRYMDIAEDNGRYSRIIDHCAMYYLIGFEPIEKGAIAKVINSGKPFLLRSCVLSVLTHVKNKVLFKRVSKQEIEDRVLLIWKSVLDAAKTFDQNGMAMTKSSSVRLLSTFRTIDDKVYSLLMDSCAYANHGYNTPDLIKELDRIKTTGDPELLGNYIADIYLEMLGTFIPDYDPQHIQSTLRHLYETGGNQVKKKCDQICNLFGAGGIYILREIFEENNPL